MESKKGMCASEGETLIQVLDTRLTLKPRAQDTPRPGRVDGQWPAGFLEEKTNTGNFPESLHSSTNKAHLNRNSATEHRVEQEDKSSAQERKRGAPPPPPWLSAKDPFQERLDMFQGTLGHIPFLIRGLMH